MSVKFESFALSNPISVLLGKEPKDFTREDLIKIIREKELERITFHYTGIDGKVKELRIPICNTRQAEMILTEGERVDGSSLFKGIVDAGSSDMYVVPVYKTAFLNPFDNKSIDFVCRFLNKKGERADFAPDNILHKAHKLLKDKTGLELWALGELEFYLIGQTNNYLYPMPKQRGYHAAEPFIKSAHVLNEMVRYIAQISGNVKYAHYEVGYLERIESDYPELNGKSAEQVEVEFLPTPIEDTGDIIVLSRWIIRNVAFKHGFSATFVPKLEIGHAGNGMHFHLQLMKDNKNIMTDDSGTLTDEAKMLIGGLCYYAPSLTGFGNMVTASYLRLVPHQEAPTRVCWSEMNRSALIRVPLGWNNLSNLASVVNECKVEPIDKHLHRQTVEIRSPDGSGNAHLLLSGITLAAEWGLSNKEKSLDIAKNSYVSTNIHSSGIQNELPELATSCVESSEKLLQHRALYERDNIFPPQVISYVAAQLQNENDKDLNQRLLSLPDDEKLKESRRIMHRDIHKN
jgi:glutamine synthetase